MPDADRLAFGDFVLDRLQQRVLHRDGTTVALSPRLICALTLLIDHAGQLLDKETLIAALWPNVVVEDNNLSQVVSALRRALGDDSQDSRFIQTVPRRGFRFIAPVTPLPPSAEATSRSPPREVGDVVESRTRATAVPAATADLGTAGARHPSLGGRRRWLHLALGSAALAGVGGMGWWARHQLPLRTAADGTTLAVLPFRPLVSDGRDELLEVGMADSLIARLSLVPGLVVRSTGSIRR